MLLFHQKFLKVNTRTLMVQDRFRDLKKVLSYLLIIQWDIIDIFCCYLLIQCLFSVLSPNCAFTGHCVIKSIYNGRKLDKLLLLCLWSKSSSKSTTCCNVKKLKTTVAVLKTKIDLSTPLHVQNHPQQLMDILANLSCLHFNMESSFSFCEEFAGYFADKDCSGSYGGHYVCGCKAIVFMGQMQSFLVLHFSKYCSVMEMLGQQEPLLLQVVKASNETVGPLVMEIVSTFLSEGRVPR